MQIEGSHAVDEQKKTGDIPVPTAAKKKEERRHSKKSPGREDSVPKKHQTKKSKKNRSTVGEARSTNLWAQSQRRSTAEPKYPPGI